MGRWESVGGRRTEVKQKENREEKKQGETKQVMEQTCWRCC